MPGKWLCPQCDHLGKVPKSEGVPNWVWRQRLRAIARYHALNYHDLHGGRPMSLFIDSVLRSVGLD